MKTFLERMVESLIKNDTKTASKAFNSYITNKTKAIFEQNNTGGYPFVTAESDGNYCRLQVFFEDKKLAQQLWDDMIKIVDDAFVEFNAVDSEYDEEVTQHGSVWIFNAEPSQHERIRQVISNRLDELVDEYSMTDSSDEYDDTLDRNNFDQDKAASDAEDNWMKGRGY